MWKFQETDELFHYGIPGMRWGHRRGSAVSNAYKEYKQAKKDVRKAHLTTLGRHFSKSQYVAGIANNARRAQLNKKVNDARAKREKAAFKVIDAKAKAAYDKKLAKTGSKEKAEKASMKVHVKAFNKGTYGSGRVGSAADAQKRHGSSGGNTRYFNHLAKTKGKEYASKVEKKYNNKTTRALIAAVGLTVGTQVALRYGERHM